MQAHMPVVMLSEQYRMAPAISAFPSRFFYEGRLVDGAGTLARALPVTAGKAYLQTLAIFDCRLVGLWQVMACIADGPCVQH